MSESNNSSSKEENEEDKYEMQEILGEGTYGVVYKAKVIDSD